MLGFNNFVLLLVPDVCLFYVDPNQGSTIYSGNTADYSR